MAIIDPKEQKGAQAGIIDPKETQKSYSGVKFGAGLLEGATNDIIRLGQLFQKSARIDPSLVSSAIPGLGNIFGAAPDIKQTHIPQATGKAGSVGKFVGSMIPFIFTPEVEGAGLITRAVTDAGLGASQDPNHPLRGALVTGGLSGGLRLIPKLSYFKRISALRNTNAQKALGIEDQNILDDAESRAAIAKEAGVPHLTAGSLTRIPDIQAREELILKSGGREDASKLQQTASNINRQVINSAQDIQKSLGGIKKTAVAMGSDVHNVLRGARKESMRKISDIYNSATEAAGTDTQIPKEDILGEFKDLKENVVDFRVPPAIKDKLDILGKQPLTVKNANKLAVSLNKAIRGTQDRTLRMGYSRLLNKTYDAMDSLGDNDDTAARDLFVMGRQARKALGDVFDQKDIVHDIVSNKSSQTLKVNPEKVVDKIFGRTNNITNLNKIESALKFKIDESGKRISNPEGAKIWDDLKATKFGNIISRSTDIANDEPTLIYSKLVKNIEQTGDEVMGKLINNPEVSRKFNNLIKTMEIIQNKAPGTINYSNTANIINRLAKKTGASLIKLLPFGGFAHDFVKSVTDHASDARWVENNLRFQDRLKILQKASQKSGKKGLGDMLTRGARSGLLAGTANILGDE